MTAVATGADSSASVARQAWRVLLALAIAFWLILILLVLSHRIFVTNDSLSNYAHVWYASDQLWSGQGLPLHMPLLDHGGSFAFPYAFVPWASAALLRPLFGDWIVTLWLAGGTAWLLVATFWSLRELRSPAWAVLVLINPLLIEALILGQLPFVWAAALLMTGVGCWRRGHLYLATAAVGLAQATHPAVMLPLIGLLVAAACIFDTPNRRRLIIAYTCSLVVAAPAAYIVLASPVVTDASRALLLSNFIGTVGMRLGVVGWPFLLVYLKQQRLVAPVFLLAFAIFFAHPVAYHFRQDAYAWGALTRSPDDAEAQIVASDVFAPGATYRLLRAGDGKVGMYQLIQAGGHLDADFFPESLDRRSFVSREEYSAFLLQREIDYVLIFDSYDERYRKNEHDLLRLLATLENRGDNCSATPTAKGADWELFAIDCAADPGVR